MNYEIIKPKIKSGEELFKFKQNKLSFKLLDFWKWSVSDLISNATRGRLAEFIVAMATNVDFDTPRDEWAAYDLITPENIKIEVKSAAYIQSWHQEKPSAISFSIKPSFYWDNATNKQSKTKDRYADVYVMCLLSILDQEKINPLDLDQWKFYVLSVKKVNDYKRSQQSITLKSLERLTKPISYNQINQKVKDEHTKNSTALTYCKN
ncbi:MAG: hypothetical protein KAQ87_00055 [Candidatus Pacebacteria bacterium]|nr:hypothetical protein [Candidatus Paceibacterota bacterium]